MNFVSLDFFFFLCVTFALYYGVGITGTIQLVILVVMSGVFYAWNNPALLPLLVTVALLAAGASLVILRAGSYPLRAIALAGTTACLLGILAYFKYGHLLFTSLIGVERMPEWQQFFAEIPLPIGISFYIFHCISLLVDSWRGSYRLPPQVSAPSHCLRTCLYIAFFPQLVAGPIVKARDFLPQIARKNFIDIDWEGAFRLLTLGYFLKTVIADNLAVQTQAMTYPYFQNYSSSRLIALLLAYSCQIFADFFGYSLIAMGLATLFGYRLPVNFNRPYIAASFSEFWRRWHISLSTWLRDYLYVPLGGSRRGTLRTYLNLFIVMFLGGLWHGAAWSYAIWGTLHGIALALERPFLDTWIFRSDNILIKGGRIFAVFSFVSVAWLFFKFRHAAEAFAYLSSIFHNLGDEIDYGDLSRIYVYCLPVFIYHAMLIFNNHHLPTRYGRVLYALFLVLILTNHGTPGAFIYFQF